MESLQKQNTPPPPLFAPNPLATWRQPIQWTGKPYLLVPPPPYTPPSPCNIDVLSKTRATEVCREKQANITLSRLVVKEARRDADWQDGMRCRGGGGLKKFDLSRA